MELIIKQEAFREDSGFTVRVDTERKDFKVGDIICCYVQEFPNFQDKTAPPHIPAYWYLHKIKTETIAKFYRLVDKHYKVLEIC